MNAAEIAASLTKAQREAVLSAEVVPLTKGVMVLPIYRDAGAMSRSLKALGIVGYSSRGPALNKVGKQVRAILQAKEPTDER